MPVHTDDAFARPTPGSTGNDHIPIEACPNVQTGAAPDLGNHPDCFYFDYGLRVTVNAGDRLITDTRDLEDLTTMIVSGFKSAFRPYRERVDLLAAVNPELQRARGRFRQPRPRVAA